MRAGFFVDARAADDAAALVGQFLDFVAIADFQFAPVRMRFDRGDERHDEPVACAPDDVKTRHAVAGLVQAAFDPVDHGQELDAARDQPVADIGATATDERFSPAARPHVLFRDLAEGQPIGEGEFGAILNAGTALLGRVDAEDAAKRDARQSAQTIRRGTVEEQNPLAGVEQLEHSCQPGEAAAQYQRVRGIGRGHDAPNPGERPERART